MYPKEAFIVEIGGGIPVKCLKIDKIHRYLINNRKNDPYFNGNKSRFQFKRNFSVYFSNNVKSTCSNSRTIY